MNIGGSPTAIRVIVISTGNSVPSERMAVISSRRPSTLASPVAT